MNEFGFALPVAAIGCVLFAIWVWGEFKHRRGYNKAIRDVRESLKRFLRKFILKDNKE